MPVEYKLAVRDGGRAREVMLVGTVTVGRSPTCEISSADPRLSRTHATFDIVDGEVVVRDLESSNGTTVNGARITEHHLRSGEQVEVGPFIIELITPAGGVAEPRPHANSDNEATVMLPAHARAAVSPTPSAEAVIATPPAATKDPDNSSSRTRLMPRIPPPAEMANPAPVAPAAPDTPRTQRPVSPESSTNLKLPQPVQEDPAPVAAEKPKVRRAATELTFANAALLWIVPIVLISFLAGLVPDFTQPDERAPLLRAHYVALATTAVDLVKASREPAMPIDGVTTALRGQLGVTGARIIGADGRLLAPLDQAGTTVPPPKMAGNDPSIAEMGNGSVDVQVPARTADGQPVLVDLTVNPERIHPAPPGSPLATVLLLVSLGAAWLVARRLTQITDSRLSRLGEEVELMTTRQITTGRDPFTLTGGQRILDAVTFALSTAGRIASDAPRASAGPDSAFTDMPASASIDADAGFRIVAADRGCEGLLGLNSVAAPGMHLIDALPDQAVADEVMRLVTMATPSQPASGEAVSGDRNVRLAITVTKGAGDAPLAIRFKRL